MSVRVFILRSDGGEDGPYEEEVVLDALETGELSPLDWCRIGEEPQAQRLGEVFERVRLRENERSEACGNEESDDDPEPDREGAGWEDEPPEGPDNNEEQPVADDEEPDGEQAATWDDGEDEEEDEGGEQDEEQRGDEELDDNEQDEDEQDEDEGDAEEDAAEEEEAEVGAAADDGAEVLVYRGTPSVLAYGPALGIAAAVLAAGYWAGQFGVKWVTGGLAVALFLVVRVLLHRGAREYVVTSERVQSTTGWISKSTRRIPLAELTAIRLHRGGVLGRLGVGTVVFSGGGGPRADVVFERVWRARRVIERVREWQEAGRK